MTAVLMSPTSWKARLSEVSVIDTVLVATPFVAILNGSEPAWLLLPAAALAFLVVSNGTIRRSPVPWLVVGAVSLVWDRLNWYGLDDHVVLTHYWLVAIGCALFATDSGRSLELNARLLIGLTFVFAIASKIVWGEVLDGSFYRAILLIDTRFVWLADLAGIDDPAHNRAQLERVHDVGSVRLDGGERATVIAGAMTAGTLLLESVLAASFLAPLRGAWRRLRTWSLAAFCVATYALVPVAGFGSLLLVMASSERRLSFEVRLAHYVAALALVVWVPVWSAVH
jgi:hypothetical protein